MSLAKVAIIEDDLYIVDMYRTRLELGGFTVKEANDGMQGLKLVEEFKPDIILLDLMMPKMSGIETLTKLRQQKNGQLYKIIALTNMGDDETVAQVKKLGVNDYIVKAESSPGELERRVREVLGLTS